MPNGKPFTHSISLSIGKRAAISSAEIVPGGWTCLDASFSFLSSLLDFAGAPDWTIMSSTDSTCQRFVCVLRAHVTDPSGWQRCSTITFRQVPLWEDRTDISVTDHHAVTRRSLGSPSLALKPRGNGTRAGRPGPESGNLGQHRFILFSVQSGLSLAIHSQEILSLLCRRSDVFRCRRSLGLESFLIFEEVLFRRNLCTGGFDFFDLFLLLSRRRCR